MFGRAEGAAVDDEDAASPRAISPPEGAAAGAASLVVPAVVLET